MAKNKRYLKLKELVKSSKDGKGGPGYCAMHGKYDGHGGPGVLPPGPGGVLAPSNPIAPTNPLAGPASAGPAASIGAPGAPSAMPPMGTAVNSGSFTPQQQASMSQMGMTPMGMGSPQAVPGGAMPPFAPKIANRPHRSMRGSVGKLGGVKKTTVKGILSKLRAKSSKTAPVHLRRPVF